MKPPDLSGFGSVRILEPLPGGNRSAVFKVQIADRLFAAKSTRRSEAAVRWMARLMDEAAALGLSVPRMQRAASGGYVSGGFTLETFCEGRAFPAERRCEVLKLIGRLHAATEEWEQRPGFASSRDLLTRADGGDARLSLMPAEAASLCRTAWRRLADGPMAAIHGDLGPGNLMAAPDGSPVIIDWDECRLDSPVFDLAPLRSAPGQAEAVARLAWEAAACWELEPDYARSRLAELQRIAGHRPGP